MGCWSARRLPFVFLDFFLFVRKESGREQSGEREGREVEEVEEKVEDHFLVRSSSSSRLSLSPPGTTRLSVSLFVLSPLTTRGDPFP